MLILGWGNGRGGVGEGREGKPGDYHDSNSMLKYPLAITADKCVSNCRGSQGLKQINKNQSPGVMFGSDLVSGAVGNQRKLSPFPAFLGLADPCLLSLDNRLLGRLEVGWMFWPYWNREEQNIMAISTWGLGKTLFAFNPGLPGHLCKTWEP